MRFKMKYGLILILGVLYSFLILGCNTPLNEQENTGESIYSARAVGDTLFNIVRNNVTFVGIQTGTNTVTLNMVSAQGTKTVNYTVKTYTYIGVLNNSVTRSNTLYQGVYQTETFYLPSNGAVAITINSVN